MHDSIVNRAILFADVVGFSKLPDSAYPGFMAEFLADADLVLSDARHTALARNTWGDAIFAVFKTASEAAHAALALQDLVRSHHWTERFGLDAGAVNLQLRIGLHAGPLFEGQDPITKTLSFMGKHANLAARIEPIAEEGHVYVSGEFAAMATLANPDEFQFDYVGQRSLPKNYDVIPVFRLSPGSIT